MIAILGLSLILQQTVPAAADRKRDSANAAIDKKVQEHVAAAKAAQARSKARSEEALKSLTPELMASAYKDRDARDLLLHARRARLIQDSTLVSYDANSYQRVSGWLGFGSLTRPRLIFRMEQAGRVRWHRDVGFWMDVTGPHIAPPGIPGDGEKEANKEISGEWGNIVPVPYVPGSEPHRSGQELMRDTVEDIGPIHPLAVGSELYYTYSSGDSVSFHLADGTVIQIRSLEIRPPRPAWNLVGGSLWFDTPSAQLVRAAYRFAVPMHIDAFLREQDPHASDAAPVWVKPLIFPMHAESAASLRHMRCAREQPSAYPSVTARGPLPPSGRGSGADPPASLDSAGAEAWRASVRTARREARRAHRDSVRQKLLPPEVAPCDTSAMTESMQRLGETKVPIAIRTPCSADALAHSKDLPASIFDANDELFDAASRHALINQALSMGAQPPLTLRWQMLPRPTVNYGLQLTRFNRVEGLSLGAGVQQELGGGYTVNAVGRLSTARWSPDAELSVKRSNLTSAIIFTGYHRLVSANDCGNPLSFGSSVSGPLFGRDQRFYSRATRLFVGRRMPRAAPPDFTALFPPHPYAHAPPPLSAFPPH